MYPSNRFPRSSLQLGITLGAVCVASTMPLLAKSEDLKSNIPVAVKLVGDDGLTQKLSISLKDRISRSDNLLLVQDIGPDNFVITSTENVNWDELAGRTVIIYHVQLAKAGRLAGDKVGVCFEKQADKCAKDIVGQFGRIMATRG